MPDLTAFLPDPVGAMPETGPILSSNPEKSPENSGILPRAAATLDEKAELLPGLCPQPNDLM